MSLRADPRFSRRMEPSRDTANSGVRTREILDAFDSVTQQVKRLGTPERGRLSIKRTPLSWFNTATGEAQPVRYLTDGWIEFNARGQVLRLVANVTHGRKRLSYSMTRRNDGASVYTVWGAGCHEQVKVNPNGTVDYSSAGRAS